MIFFSTSQPNADICGFGGRSRLWGLNCATGDAITSKCQTQGVGGGNYTIDLTSLKSFTILLQLSGGNIEEFKKEDFTKGKKKATLWKEGITPEGSPVITYPASLRGKILLWIER